MFTISGILTGLKALPNSGKTAKYLRDTARTLTSCFTMMYHYFLLAKSFPDKLKDLASTQFKLLTSKQVLPL